jgi:nitrite reductase/ring-hydroxylating ferredoxin subunit
VGATGSFGAWRCAAADVGPGRGVRFQLAAAGRAPVDGFVVNHGGDHHAYVNCCPHAGAPLDRLPHHFLTEDARYLRCSTHGAVFAPETGICVEGPCPGARLQPLRVERVGQDLVITWPT